MELLDGEIHAVPALGLVLDVESGLAREVGELILVKPVGDLSLSKSESHHVTRLDVLHVFILLSPVDPFAVARNTLLKFEMDLVAELNAVHDGGAKAIDF